MYFFNGVLLAIQPLTLALAIVGKIGSAGAFGVVYVFSAELFPTVVRNAGMGASSCIARVGGMLAPYVASSVRSSVFYKSQILGHLRNSSELIFPLSVGNAREAPIGCFISQNNKYHFLTKSLATQPLLIPLSTPDVQDSCTKSIEILGKLQRKLM